MAEKFPSQKSNPLRRQQFELLNAKMASVYKSLSKASGRKDEVTGPANGVKKNKQRVLILSSRGITYR